jgi:hypothetical protein
MVNLRFYHKDIIAKPALLRVVSLARMKFCPGSQQCVGMSNARWQHDTMAYRWKIAVRRIVDFGLGHKTESAM